MSDGMTRARWLLAGAMAGVLALAGCGQTASDAGMGTEADAGQKGDADEDTPGQTDEERATRDYLVLVSGDTELPANWDATVDLIGIPDPQGEEGDFVLVEPKAYDAFLELQRDMFRNEGIDIEIAAAYRSPWQQQAAWDDCVEQHGEDYAADHEARPGHSEHQTGLAIDLYLVVDGEAVTDDEGLLGHTELWEKVHAGLADHGFVLRYPEGKDDVTGHDYEPWHIRYVGDADTAHEMADAGLTLEEYLQQEDDGSD